MFLGDVMVVPIVRKVFKMCEACLRTNFCIGEGLGTSNSSVSFLAA